MSSTIDRRGFLGRSLAASAAVAATAPSFVEALNAAAGAATEGSLRTASHGRGGYGPLAPKRPTTVGPGIDPDVEWVALPEGFKYSIFGVSGTVMSDGNVTPYGHDGMGAFRGHRGRVHLVRNHEVRDPAGIAAPPSPVRVYDPMSGGGNTTLVIGFDRRGVPRLESDFVSLSGTHTNCAGGEAPWGSWLTCEETTVGLANGFQAEHGYVYDVPSSADGPVRPVPLKGLGRFDHEALCVDPDSGIVYETEDNGDSGFFRFVPDRRGRLTSGQLQMLKVKGVTNYDTRTGQRLGRELDVEWVDIDDPDPAVGGSKTVYNEGFSKGAAIFRRLEGIWFDDGTVFFTSTDGGNAGQGQVWRYEPGRRHGHGHGRGRHDRDEGELSLVYESPGSNTLSFPDNLNITPRGGIILCEDTGRPPISLPFSEQFLKGLTQRGEIFDFALNIADGREWAGACWSPGGQYLFVNTQGETAAVANPRPSRTYAIWGPWRRGAL
ncbi:MAG: alkaline phosphatase PhoX [Acidimicrobiales bacterium]